MSKSEKKIEKRYKQSSSILVFRVRYHFLILHIKGAFLITKLLLTKLLNIHLH